MAQTLRLGMGFLMIIIFVFCGYEIGRFFGKKESQTQLIENYSFVRDIAQLATIEVNGVTNYTSTNLANDGSFSDVLKKAFTENTIHISMPYTAKYGVDLQDSSLKIIRKDSFVEIHLSAPKLLSYELRIDKMDATNRKGWALFQNDETFLPYQKKLYAQSRAQLEQNAIYLNQSRDRACTLLERYFMSLNLRSVCIFDLPSAVNVPKG